MLIKIYDEGKNTMNRTKEEVIKSVLSEGIRGDLTRNNIENYINLLENTYIMCVSFNPKGICKLKNRIKHCKKLLETL